MGMVVGRKTQKADHNVLFVIFHGISVQSNSIPQGIRKR
ncbi:MAG: hypothetical protein JETT_3696 [Candidatus Jettenia ecosi]|uniref:Uncharacterized protein n=1 Tax=Candidatus Jettenia ecosi TaxID=2494326 RepID=A0A533Q649_9BACT|nr:MAG: hypothetical protein JETT_3696 [Candidatus Jettenia ecosi]